MIVIIKIFEFANSIVPDEATHIEPLHLDLHCLPASLWIFKTNICFEAIHT